MRQVAGRVCGALLIIGVGCVAPPRPTGGACDLDAGHSCPRGGFCFQSQCVDPSSTALVFTSPAVTALVDACSPPLTLQSQDVHGNAVVASADAALAISASASGVSFFADNACTTALTAPKIAAGTSQLQLYFRSSQVTAPGGLTVTAQSTGWISGAQTATVVSIATPTRLAFAHSPRTAIAGQCSPPVTVRLHNVLGAATNATSSVTVSLSSSAPSVQLYSDVSCTAATSAVTIGAGFDSRSFYFSGDAGGTVPMSASAPTLAPATQTEGIAPGPPSSLVFLTNPFTGINAVGLGACSPALTVQLRDQFGNPSPVAGKTIDLASDGVNFLFYDTPDCATPVVTVPLSDSATATFYAQLVLGLPSTVTITASDSDVAARAASQAMQLIVRGPTKLAFVSPPQTVVQGICSGPLVLQAQDAAGFAAPVSSATAATLGTNAGVATFYSAAGCGAATLISEADLATGESQVTVYFVASPAGTPTLSATHSLAMLTTAFQTETIVGPNPTRLSFSTAPQTVIAGTCSGPITVSSMAAGTPASVNNDTLITLTTSGTAAATIYQGAGCTGAPIASTTLASGASSATISITGPLAGVATVAASANGLASNSQNETIVAADAGALEFLNAPVAVPLGQCSGGQGALTVELVDEFGNASPASSTTSVALAVPPQLTAYASPDCSGAPIGVVPVAAGSSMAPPFFVKGAALGAFAIDASSAALTDAGQLVTIQ